MNNLTNSQRFAHLSPEMRARLFAELQRQKAQKQTTTSVIPQRTRDTSLIPVSFAQQRLWFLEQLVPGSPFYNNLLAIQITGNLQVAVFVQSLNEIVARHEALRTTFSELAGQPMQSIASTLSIPVPIVDLQGIHQEQRQNEVQQLLQQYAQHAFDLKRGPLFRATILKLEPQTYGLLLNMHHIVTDGWSMGILFRELSQLYRAFITQSPSPLPPLSIQYADFALWQRQWLQGEVQAKLLAYWSQQLADLPVLHLPTDYPRPSIQTFQGTQIPFHFSPQLSQQLLQFSQQEGATLYMTLLAALQVLLWRYSGQHDFAIGMPIANRTRRELEALIGFFVNTLVLRVQLTDTLTVRQFLQRVREKTLEAHAHQDLPFEYLVEQLQPERDLSRNPLFQVMFMLLNTPQVQVHSAGLTFTPLTRDMTTAKFDLTLLMMETEEGITGRWEYNTDLFTAQTINQMHIHWQRILEAMVARPEQSLAQISLLSKEEEQQLLQTWTGPQMTSQQALCLHDLFAVQAQRTPDACAITSGEQHISYHRLNVLAQQLADRLHAQGVGPDQLVGLCLNRSIELLIAMLGILKAGGAYVPLDPAYPQPWLEQVIAQAGLKLLLTQEALRQRLVSTRVELLCLDSDQHEQSASTQAATASYSSDQLAYVIYTSGSTGTPKGVAMPHCGLVNMLKWQGEHSTMGLHNRTLQFTSISFDVSCQEIFATWSTGGNLVLIDQQTRQDAQLLLHCLSEQGIERLFLPFIALHHLGQVALQPDTLLPESLREVLTAGEKLQISRPLIAFFKRLPGCRLMNHYGPSETHLATAFTLESGPDSWDALPPIGKALNNANIAVLDEHLQPVPIGAIGELYIGGVGLARGYWQRADLTAERFVPHPFSAAGGARLYRTGDQVRSRADGTLEFVGRRDLQVKVRGYRIELEQIEAVMKEHPGVRAAAIGIQEGEIGDKRLIAYIEPQENQPLLTLRELRRYVGARLPDYMQPVGLVEVPHLPLTDSGKVDRRALTRLEAPTDHLQRDTDGQEPRSAMEQLVLDIWQQVLKQPRMGVLDNFFELGGHSLLATQVVARMQQVFQINVPVRSLFEHPTIAGLAALLEQHYQQTSIALPLLPVSRDRPLPLSFAQQRLWFLDQWQPGSIAYTLPAAVRLRGPLDLFVLEQALATVIQRHENLRTTFPSQQGKPVQHISPEPLTRLLILDLRHLPQEVREGQARLLLQQGLESPFDLTHGPLLRCWLLPLAEQDQILLLSMHHIISDGWSNGILVRELTTLYAALQRGEAPATALPALPIQYADYAIWQRQWLQGEVLEELLQYWQRQLSAPLPVLNLPTDYPSASQQTSQGAASSFLLPAELTDGLHALRQQEGATLFMVLCAAFAVLLHHHTAQEDLVIGTDIANRSRVEIEGLIGFFVNQLALRIDLPGNPDFLEIVQRVRDVSLKAYTHQDLPFDRLVEALNPTRDLSHTPLFQVKFALQNLPEQAFALENLTMELIESEHITAKVDLALTMREHGHELLGRLEYRTDLFQAETITRFIQHFIAIISAVIAHPAIHLEELDAMLAATERAERERQEQELQQVGLQKLKRRKRTDGVQGNKEGVNSHAGNP